ncbi:metallophosphoesterase [Pyrococcus horikoshii]|uniref:Calcineurin-like phosphoesterase domain-containing protein n=2 Tax=Pyrococcus horikoshii TaxID=53953 RepID=O58375_PYRHO|nr:metallophosphoesterase [Pyrococcus horikoshii]BAA29732.1 213aa long hypothetical protein [Pyrococcus horikoshii OT3]HII60839.1 metallophosphoesterase [Pyrococcus horikoshii]
MLDFSIYSFYFETKLGKTLVFADPHLGFERFRGINVRSKLEIKLAKFINEEKPDAVIILGDVKEDIGLSKFTEKILLDFFSLLRDVQVIITKGNHDGKIEEVTTKFENVNVVEFFLDKGLLFVHGHKNLPNVKFKKVIMGHIHPSILISTESGVRRKVKCFLRTSDILVFPTINPFYEGINFRDGIKMSPILKNYKEFEIIIPPGIYLKKVSI